MFGKSLTTLVIVALLISIAGIFWWQEWQYLLPTPKPTAYAPPPVAAPVQVAGIQEDIKPVFLYFFNPDCPCSRFNEAHFRKLMRMYGDRVHFQAVLQVDSSYSLEDFREEYGWPVDVLLDTGAHIADACGVYSTPQAVLLTPSHTLYYRGNFNRSRYCEDTTTAYAQKAVQSLLRGEMPPDFGPAATTAYGCELPARQSDAPSWIF